MNVCLEVMAGIFPSFQAQAVLLETLLLSVKDKTRKKKTPKNAKKRILTRTLKTSTEALTRPTFGQVWSTAMLVLQYTCFDI